jgi:hypothetical protein
MENNFTISNSMDFYNTILFYLVDEIVFDPEEISNTKYNIVLCETYNKKYHGKVEGDINQHYLTLFRLKDMSVLNDIINRYPNVLPNRINRKIRLEIAECIYLPSEHCVSILKTFWIKIIQRVWKKVFQKRRTVIAHRSNYNALKYKEIYGYWPENCSYYPQLKGMLSNLSHNAR